MISDSTIVVCGHDQLLLKTRESLLVSRGYSVRALDLIDDVVRMLQASLPQLVVICHTVSLGEKERLRKSSYAQGCGKLLLLCPETQKLKMLASGTWSVSSGDPRLFLSAVREVLVSLRQGPCSRDVSDGSGRGFLIPRG